jgi:ferric-dicitrate binding protein FerR (iron transport regulator)
MELGHDIDIETLFEKMCSGNLDDREKDRLRSYIESTFHDEKLNDLMYRHWRKLDNPGQVSGLADLEHIKMRLWSKIMTDQLASAKTAKQKLTNWKTYLTRAAAILVIPLLIFSGYLYFHPDQQFAEIAALPVMQRVVATPGSRVHFTLPDRSEVWLNSGSSLEFPITLNVQEKRKVKLTGQGYFHVSHDSKRPFLVETGTLNIQVMGTSFDVSGYDDDQTMSSTLEEGSIALLNLKGDEVARMEPGQKAVLDKQTRKLSIEKVDTRLTTSWKDGKLMFRDTPLPEVTKQLERWFNCTIHVDPELNNSDILYTATIQDETLGEVLKMIEISTSVKTRIKNREVSIWHEN